MLPGAGVFCCVGGVPFFESVCGAQSYGLWLVSVLLIMLLSGIRVVGMDFSIYWISE